MTAGTWTRAADAVTSDSLTPLHAEAVAEVQALACDFDGSAAKLAAVRGCTTGRQRWLAIRHTPPAHPAFRPLMALLDALVASDPGTTMTNQGAFPTDDIIAAEPKIERENGIDRICFPVRYPWSQKPDPETGFAGVRAPAIYRSAAERGPSFGASSDGTKEREREWWEEDEA
jgi:hypothetical protein